MKINQEYLKSLDASRQDHIDLATQLAQVKALYDLARGGPLKRQAKKDLKRLYSQVKRIHEREAALLNGE